MSKLLVNTIENGLVHLKLTSSFRVLGKPQSPSSQLAVRWYRPRKPFWLPVAKSKMFRIPKQPEIPKEEHDEIVRLYNIYRTQMKSLRAHFKENLMSQITGPEVIAERKHKEAEQHAWCIQENNKWNAEVAKSREERLAQEAIIREKKILDKILTHETKQKELVEQLDKHIRMEKEAAKSFITAANIDEAIENVLNTVVDHNFCIDLQGNIYKGRYGRPSPSPSGPRPGDPSPPAQQSKVKVEVRS